MFLEILRIVASLVVSLAFGIYVAEKLGWRKNGSKPIAEKTPYIFFGGNSDVEAKESNEADAGFIAGILLGIIVILGGCLLVHSHEQWRMIFVICKVNLLIFGVLYILLFFLYRIVRRRTRTDFNPWPQICRCPHCEKPVYIWQRKIKEYGGVFSSAGGGHPFTDYYYIRFHIACHKKFFEPEKNRARRNCIRHDFPERFRID